MNWKYSISLIKLFSLKNYSNVKQVQIVNGGAAGSGYHQSYHREGHYSSGGGGRIIDGSGTYGRSSKSKFVVAENGPQYVVRR